MHVNPTGSILDVGCGTGALLNELAATFSECTLAGIDPSPEMLSIARQRLLTNVELQQGWAEKIPYSSGTFDTVVSCNMFHYIRQPNEALIEMTRVLRTDGAFAITDWCADYLACRIFDWYFRLFNAAHFQTYRAGECRKLLENVETTGIKIDSYKITWLWGLMTATARKRATDTERCVGT